MQEYKDIKATVVAYNKEWRTISATLDLGGAYPKALTVKVPVDEFEKLFRYPVKNVISGSSVLSEETDVIFKNARYTGATTSGAVWMYEADAIELILK